MLAWRFVTVGEILARWPADYPTRRYVQFQLGNLANDVIPREGRQICYASNFTFAVIIISFYRSGVHIISYNWLEAYLLKP